jgi:large subunit ribosomal protein L32
MAVPKRKTSKMKKRQRVAANRFKGIQVPTDANGIARLPHRICPETGTYNGRQIIAVKAD